MYNPSDTGKKGTVFGLPYTEEESDLVLIPVHLDTTVSYGEGTAKAPKLILSESTQLDLSSLTIKEPWKLKMAMQGRFVKKSLNDIHRGRAKNVIKALEGGKKPDEKEVHFVNEFCEKVRDEVRNRCISLLASGKFVGVIGGDHSSPLGLLEALAERQEFGILQIDAHMDLRDAYEGFEFSHASIMHNVLQNKAIKKLVQVGIRDFCEEEENYVAASEERVQVFYDEHIYKQKEQGRNWYTQCQAIVDILPDFVYISFDMDGLDPSLCPNTGTPVPGGLSFNEAKMLVETVVRSGRKIIGFDVCETGNDPWDANVASRIIFLLSTLMGVSQDLLEFRE